MGPASLKFKNMENDLAKLNCLHISPSSIERLDFFSILLFSSLSELYLDLVPPSTISGLYEFRNQLKVLAITNSGMHTIASAVAATLPSETISAFSPIVLQESSSPIPPSLLWTRLAFMRLSNCGIAKLDGSLHLLPTVKSIDLSHNDISHVIHLHDCYSLSTLDLSYNRIRCVSIQ
jgi:Leucine-rich repeat (LRR) protein